MPDRYQGLRDAIAAGPTKGPWRWEVNLGTKSINLVGGRPTFDKIVMDFARWGMNHACPRFNEEVAGGDYNLMSRAADVHTWLAPFPGREHHASWCQSVTHPDARWMEAADPDTIAALLADNDKMRESLTAIAKGAPIEQPEWIETDNHGDTAYNAAEIEHYRLASIARAALADGEAQS